MVGRATALAAALGTVVALVTPVLPQAVAALPQASVVSDNPANWTPNVLDGSVKAVVQVGNTMIVGGAFTQVQGSEDTDPILARSNIFAFDATTGVISTTFTATTDGEVSAIVVSDDLVPDDQKSIYIAGQFNTVNGTTSRKIAKLSAATGTKDTAFNPGAISSKINDMALSHGRLIIGGQFNTIKGVSRPILASLNPTTGALTSDINISFTGMHNGGTTAIVKFAVDPDGNRLVAIGNFTTVGGLDRHQVAMLDISGDTSVVPASVVTTWRTTLYTSTCANAFDTYMRDLDISPDGTYVVISTTGAYRGSEAGCDVISRFEMGASGTDVRPTWRDYTGGDTTYAVAATGGVVYVGGHFRWMNNAMAGDQAGPGAVPREGIAALDPENGLPLSWNPGRERGVGVYDLLATPSGLWVGSDTERIANEARKRIAFMPLAGGTALPAKTTGTLPNETYLLGGSDPSVLYRINAGGPELGSADDGVNWAADQSSTSTLRTTGSTASTFSAIPTLDATVPNTATDKPPRAIFDSTRTDPSTAPDMQWSFPAASGTPLTVRLYFANRTSSRTFAVDIDTVNRLNNFNLSSTPGNNIGTMRSFDITSDGTVNINFRRQSGDPLISAIEILDRSAVAGGSAAAGQVRHQAYTGTGAPSATTTDPGTEPWGQTRGAVLVDQTLYTGATGGTFSARLFDGRNVGTPTPIDLFGGTFAADLPNITGMVYDAGRLYFTLANDPNLYYRYFSTQARVVGTVRFLATGDITAMAPQRVAGMFLSGSTLYLADKADGRLYRVAFNHGVVTGPAQLADATINWRSRGAFMLSAPVPPAANVLPTATSSAQPCVDNVCSVSGSGSTDSDGSIVGYSWNFGDGSPAGSGVTASHAYAAAGPYTVTLTVTDDRGGTDTDTVSVTAGEPPNQAPVAAFTVGCTNLTCTLNGSGSSDTDGTVTSWAWNLGDTHSGTGSSLTYPYAAGGTYDISLVVTDNDGAPSSAVVHQVTVAPAPTSPIAFRAAVSNSGNSVNGKVTVPASVQAGDALLLFVTTSNLSTVSTAPVGWSEPATAVSGSEVRTLLYTKVATGTDASQVQSIMFAASAKWDVTLLAYSGVDANPFDSLAIASAGETVNRSSHTTPGVTVSTAGSWVVSYWADKSSATTSWSDPPIQVRRSTSTGSGPGHVTSLATDLGAAPPAGPMAGLTATADSASAKATMWSVVIKAAS